MSEFARDSIGYGLFFALNMAAMWLGVMPFVPEGLQTPGANGSFFVGSLTFEVGFFVLVALACLAPRLIARRGFWLTGLPWGAGMGLLSAISLQASVPDGLWALCGLFLGWGTAGMFVAWQRVFALSGVSGGCQENVMGTMIACAVYVVLSYLPPSPPTTALVGASALASLVFLFQGLRRAARRADGPWPARSERVDAAVRFGRDYWRTIVCLGVLGFCCGAIRCLATGDIAVAKVVNATSMAALLVVSVLFFAVWSRRAVRLSTTGIFRLLAPMVLLALALAPFAGNFYPTILSGVLFALLGCALMLMVAQCLTASARRGIDPACTYGLFAGCLWTIYDCGHFLAGSLVAAPWLSQSPLATICLLCACAVGFGLFLGQGGGKSIASPQLICVENIELVRSLGSPSPRYRETGTEEVEDDPLHWRMEEIAACYLLTAREAEIAEMVGRGMTVKQIARKLTISENTVRTHTKAVYAKLDIHKKASLMELLSAEGEKGTRSVP